MQYRNPLVKLTTRLIVRLLHNPRVAWTTKQEGQSVFFPTLIRPNLISNARTASLILCNVRGIVFTKTRSRLANESRPSKLRNLLL